MNILVTGGAGYIGSHVCKALSRSGYTPIVFDNLSNGHEWAVRWGPLEIGEINDPARLRAVLERYKPQAVMHFAAYAYVGESVEMPRKYYRNNVSGTLTLLEALCDFDIDKMVFSSTCATYGVPTTAKIAESHPQAPINPYGASKLMVERMLSDFDSAYGLRSVSLRYFNAAGADPDGDIGELHEPETHLIPLVIDVALGKRESIKVFGSDYDTPDGTCVRDYIHVKDLANAHLLALESLLGGGQTTAFNLGNGRGYSVLEVIEAVQAVSQRDVAFEIVAKRAGDPACLVGDAARIEAELGWMPEITELQAIVKTAWDWHLKDKAQ